MVSCDRDRICTESESGAHGEHSGLTERQKFARLFAVVGVVWLTGGRCPEGGSTVQSLTACGRGQVEVGVLSQIRDETSLEKQDTG